MSPISPGQIRKKLFSSCYRLLAIQVLIYHYSLCKILNLLIFSIICFPYSIIFPYQPPVGPIKEDTTVDMEDPGPYPGIISKCNHIKLFPQCDEHLFFSVPGVRNH